MTDRPKRQTLQLDITQASRQSLSIARLNDRLKNERTSIVKRALINDTLRAGAMCEEAGLSSVFAFLDTEKFNNATQQEKQLLILQALQLRLDLEPVPVILSGQPASSPEPATPPANEMAEDVREDHEEENEPPAANGNDKGPVPEAVKAVHNRFSKKFGAS